MLVRAKAAGYFVQLLFVAIDDPRTNIDRVQLRVAQGGHDVPLDKIVPRWHRTMTLLRSAIQAADRSFLFDNSATGDVDAGPTLVFTSVRGTDGRLAASLRVNPPPIWLREYVLNPLDISYSA